MCHPLVAQEGPLRWAGRAPHRCAALLRDLQRGLADPASHGMDQDPFTRLEIGHFFQPIPGSEEGKRDRRRFGKAKVCGNLRQRCRRHGHITGKRAIDNPHHPITHGPVGDARANPGHHTGTLKTERHIGGLVNAQYVGIIAAQHAQGVEHIAEV